MNRYLFNWMAASGLLFILFVPTVIFGDVSSARGSLTELKGFYESGLISEEVYKAEVQKILSLLREEQNAEPQTIPVMEKKAEPQLTQTALPGNPLAKKQQSAEALPLIDWGPLNASFSFSNVRIEDMKEKDQMGRLRVYASIRFDMQAKRNTDQSLELYTARFFDADGLEFPDSSAIIEMERERGGARWHTRERGHGNIPLLGIHEDDLKDVKTIRAERGFSALLQ
ncbi:MAG: hypothetical protein EOL87_15275 [Spartobacteria bacterium]|nr:hypothetical protein [Spartobacteria bacterium]